jgi:2-polyprenyl-3-methyl-5-hydroxy-6-metoxy-1,4-benzoquinol methylase
MMGNTTALSCRICGNPLRSHFSVDPWQISVCVKCSFAQVNPEPTSAQLDDIYRASYFSKKKYDQSFSQRKEYQRRMALLARFTHGLKPRVLDAGCGTGDFIGAAKGSYEMWGREFSDEAVKTAQAAHPECKHRISSGPIEDYDAPPNTFDAITMWDVIEHLWNPHIVVKKLLESLKPGGHLLISTPDIGAPTAKILRRRWAFMTPPEHLSFFSTPSFAELFERQLGAEICYRRSFGKWVNLGFLAYKVGRVFAGPLPNLLMATTSGLVGKLPVYVPTGDVAYVAVRKP